MYTLGNRFASAREVKEVRDRNTELEDQVANLTARLCDIEKQHIACRESRLEAQRKFSETELENAVLRGQLAVLERVLAKGPRGVVDGEGGQLGGRSEDFRVAVGSDGGH